MTVTEPKDAEMVTETSKNKTSKTSNKDKTTDGKKSSKSKSADKQERKKETGNETENTRNKKEKSAAVLDGVVPKRKSKSGSKDDENKSRKESKDKDAKKSKADRKASKEKKHKKNSKKSKGDEDEEMKKLLEKFVSETGIEDEDPTESSTGFSSVDGLDRSEFDMKDNAFDHVVLAAPDLDRAIDEFKEKTGVAPAVAGNIKGLGIKTARISFGGSSFLEIIAPDPEKGGPIGDLLKRANLSGLQPFHWAIRFDNVDELTRDAEKMGYVADCIGMSAARGDGTRRSWEALYMYGHKLRGMCPYFINWDINDHPCEKMPVVGDLLSIRVIAPKEDPVHDLLAHTNSSGFTLNPGDAMFEVRFDSPKGEVFFATSIMVGFKFPGIDDGVISKCESGSDAVTEEMERKCSLMKKDGDVRLSDDANGGDTKQIESTANISKTTSKSKSKSKSSKTEKDKKKSKQRTQKAETEETEDQLSS